jgi:NADP-dependent 3-hydroxy acid dehydrogenase YdfG
MAKDLFVVIGASSGYGQSITIQLSALGMVVVAHRSPDKVLETGTIYHCCDVRKIQDVLNLSERVQDLIREGYNLKGVVYSVGIAANLQPIGKKALSEAQDVFMTNTEGLYYALHAFIPIMPKGSTFINIGSISERKNYYGGGEYCASKAAALTLMRTARSENMAKGIKFTTVSPGMAMTQFHSRRFKGDMQQVTKATEGIKPLECVDVARIIAQIMQWPDHVCINHLEVSPTDQAEHGDDVRKYRGRK